jgi:cysteine-rich repeat protein
MNLPRSLRASALQASCAAAVMVAAVVSCTTDEIVAVEDGPDASTTIPANKDSGAPAGLCGNGVLDDGEGCDDGNAASGDGCSAVCKVEGAAAAGACPGTVLALTAQGASKRVGKIAGDTTSSGSSFDSATCGGGNGKDAVYSITSDLPGRARVRLDAKFDAYVALRTVCADPKTEATCKAVPVGGGQTEVSFPVAANTTAYVVVDGVAGKSGAFTLDVEIDATSCGDGLAQYPEQCDDTNTTAGDGCSASCQLETPLSLPGKCPGATYTMVGSAAGPTTVSFAGDVSLLASTASSLGCSSGGGKDQVYALTPTISGSLKAVLRAQYPNAQLHARRECFTSQSQMDCRVQPLASVPLEMTIPVTAQNTYFIFVDSASSSPGGPYTLDVTLSPPTCGNGSLETPEECDDGNMAAGDGCSATCTLEAAPAGIDACPGAAITLAGAPGGPLSFHTTASTSPLTTGVKAKCGTSATKDAVYTFVAPYDGWIDAKVRGAFNLALDLRSDCLADGGAAGTSLACSDNDKGNGEETVSGAVNAGQSYFLVVKGAQSTTDNEGPFSLDVALKPSVCGNGVIEGGEQCDDFGTLPGDACDAACQIEPLPVPETRTTCATAEPLVLVENPAGVFSSSVTGGNWNLPGGGSMAFPCGATTGREAYFTVTPSIDGVVVAHTVASYKIALGARPACPPNTSTGFITCSDQTSVDGERISFVVKKNTTYWIIVDSPSKNVSSLYNGRFTLDVTVKGESCGDGLVSGAEQCDDGNVTAGDGCSATCAIEPLAGTDQCPGYAVALAGVGSAVRSKVVSLSTAALASNYAGTCGGNGRDGVIVATSDVTGTMRAQLDSSWPSVLYARTTCADGGSELGCKKADLAKPNETLRVLSFDVQAGVPTFLFVDGLSGGAGPATLSLTVTP